MLKEGKIGYQEALFAVLTAMISKEVFIRHISNQQSNSSVWYALIITFLCAVAVFGMAVALINITGEENLFEALKAAFGQKIGKIVILIYGFIILQTTIQALSSFLSLITDYIFLNTPIRFIGGIMILTIAICAWMGLEGLSRASKFFLIFLIIAFFVMFFKVRENYDISRLSPFFDKGIDKTIMGGFRRMPIFCDSLLLLFLAKAVQGKAIAKKIGFIAIAVTAIIGLLILLGNALLFPASIRENMSSPIYRVINMIDVRNYYQRFDDFFVFVWLAATMIGASFSLYGTSNLYCRVFEIKDIRPIIPVMALLLYEWLMMMNSGLDWLVAFDEMLVSILWLIYSGLIVIALVVALIKRKKKTDEPKAAATT